MSNRRKDPISDLLEHYLQEDETTELEPMVQVASMPPTLFEGWHSQIVVSERDSIRCGVCEATVCISQAHFCYINVFSISPATFLCGHCFGQYIVNDGSGSGAESDAL